MKNNKSTLLFLGLILLFILVRLPGIHLPYHQDEWKNVSSGESVEKAGQFFAHPPLQQMYFVATHSIFGEDNMRLPFILFGLATAIMLYLVMLNRTDKKPAMWTATLFLVCFYNILGSLMTDVDGGILPFFFLTAVYAYDQYNFSIERKDQNKWRWFALMVLALLIGFLFKLSFVLAIGAIALDYIWNNRKKINVKRSSIFTALCAGFVLLYVFALYLIQGIYPAFSISLMLGHANQFAGEGGRNYLQIMVQGVKALYYISPLVLLPLWMSRRILERTLVFWIYLLVGFLFYFVAFDFSQGALDKYLMFIIVPLCAIGGPTLARVFEWESLKSTIKKFWPALIIGTIVSIGLISLNFIPQMVVSLYPKSEWFGRVLHGHWNVLTPLTGGSGPMGFYVSFLFIAASYTVSFVCIVVGLMRSNWRVGAGIVFVAVAFSYNVIFAEEYFKGAINGSVPVVLDESLKYIASNPDIKEVITYNDIGAQRLQNMNLYSGRFYAAPQFEEGHRVKFGAYTGEYLVVGIPPLYKGFYSDFFSKCDTLFDTRSGMIIGRVYSCKPQKP